MPVCLVQSDDACPAVECALQVVGVSAEILGAEPVDEFDNGRVPYGDACEPHGALLQAKYRTAAGSAAHIERTRVAS